MGQSKSLVPPYFNNKLPEWFIKKYFLVYLARCYYSVSVKLKKHKLSIEVVFLFCIRASNQEKSFEK
jgi:hypothetical protein